MASTVGDDIHFLPTKGLNFNKQFSKSISHNGEAKKTQVIEIEHIEKQLRLALHVFALSLLVLILFEFIEITMFLLEFCSLV